MVLGTTLLLLTTLVNQQSHDDCSVALDALRSLVSLDVVQDRRRSEFEHGINHQKREFLDEVQDTSSFSLTQIATEIGGFSRLTDETSTNTLHKVATDIVDDRTRSYDERLWYGVRWRVGGDSAVIMHAYNAWLECQQSQGFPGNALVASRLEDHGGKYFVTLRFRSELLPSSFRKSVLEIASVRTSGGLVMEEQDAKALKKNGLGSAEFSTPVHFKRNESIGFVELVFSDGPPPARIAVQRTVKYEATLNLAQSQVRVVLRAQERIKYHEGEGVFTDLLVDRYPTTSSRPLSGHGETTVLSQSCFPAIAEPQGFKLGEWTLQELGLTGTDSELNLRIRLRGIWRDQKVDHKQQLNIAEYRDGLNPILVLPQKIQVSDVGASLQPLDLTASSSANVSMDYLGKEGGTKTGITLSGRVTVEVILVPRFTVAIE